MDLRRQEDSQREQSAQDGAQQPQGASKKKSAGRRKLSSGQRIARAFGVLTLLVGVCIFLYPSASNYLFQQAQASLVQIQATAVGATSQETLDAMYAAAVEYNDRLFNSRTVITDPFDENAMLVTNEEYDGLLNLEGDGIMATITIPAVNAQLVIYHGTSDEVLQQGVGHLEGSSLPVGGESTHAVLAGHTGLSNAQIFDNIDQLEVGDYFIITVLGEELAYRVTSIEVVLPEETESLVIREGEDLITLVTCTPYGINSHRLLVHAERTEIPDEWYEEDTTVSFTLVGKSLRSSILIGLAVALAIIIVWRLISYVCKRRAAKRAAKQAALADEALGQGLGGGAGAGAGGSAPPGAGRDVGSALPGDAGGSVPPRDASQPLSGGA